MRMMVRMWDEDKERRDLVPDMREGAEDICISSAKQ
jgi:hypothetical protein